jgi:glycerol kinase
MPPTHILAIDQGTTNTKVLLVDDTGRTTARVSRPVEISFPQPGWVEQDGLALWTTTVAAIDECLETAGSVDVAAVAVTNQRESVLAWSRSTGQPVGPCIVWQCRRTAEICATLRERGLQTLIAERTGLTIDPLFSASKARWLLDHLPDGAKRAAAGEICIGTVDSWLLWNLTGGTVHATDTSNASRTQLLNLRTADWDPELLEAFGIPAAALPQVGPSSAIRGYTVGCGRLTTGIPIAALIGDSHAALFGQTAGRAGVVKATFGTGSSLMTLIDVPIASHAGLSTTVAWGMSSGVSYALEGNITVTGGAVDWFGRLLGPHTSPQDIARLADTVPDSDGVYLVPAFAGLGAPYWDDGARGVLCGLTRGTTAAHLARATIDAIAFQVRDVFDAMATDVGRYPPGLLADGGGSSNDGLMQFQADLLGRPVVRNQSTDLSALGAAWLAGLAVELWTSFEELDRLPRATDRFEPRMTDTRREQLYAGWKEAVGRSRSGAGQSVVDRERVVS